MKRIIISALLVMLLSFSVASAVFTFDLTPEDGYSVDKGVLLNLTACVEEDNETGEAVNGTLCVTYDKDRDLGYCSSPSFGEIVCVELYINTSYDYLDYGTYFWNANYTHNDSSFYESETRSYIITESNRKIIAEYPVDSETVYGDETGYKVVYEVLVYFPYDIISEYYIDFIDYDDYNGFKVNEETVCENVLINATEDNPIREGFHTYNCTNYMYNDDLTGLKYWKARLKATPTDILGANIISRTGYQQYYYEINETLAHVYPEDEAIYCHLRPIDYIYRFGLNDTLLDEIDEFCGEREAYMNDYITFYAYLYNKCGGGNLTWYYENTENSSQSSEISFYEINNDTEDYWEADAMFGSGLTNTTYETKNINYSAGHIEYYWDFDCENGTTYTTPTQDLWYITGISVVYPEEVPDTGYYVYPVNMTSGVMSSFSLYWSEFFGIPNWGGLMIISLFFILIMSLLVMLNTDAVGGGAVAIFGTLAFVRLGYIHIVIMVLLLLVSAFVFLRLIRSVILNR